ncbi:MAG: rod shape-determining protein MreC [Candidatus Aminicenantaceae bacterium]
MPLFLKEKKNLIILISLILVQFILISIQVPLGQKDNYFERALFSIFSPIQHGIISFFSSIGKIWKNYFYLLEVQSQNQIMEKEIFMLRQENNLLTNALQKFRSEKEIQENLLKMHENILPAQVIGLDATNYHKSVIINKGTMDGLKKNMVVLDKNGNLVGRVIGPISLKEARVQLITDNESGIGVFSQQERAMGVLVGDGQGQCSLEYILATTKGISEGEEVITNGFDRMYPSGIKVGKIVSINKTKSLHWQIKVEPYFDFRYLDQVAVIMKDPKEFFEN